MLELLTPKTNKYYQYKGFIIELTELLDEDSKKIFVAVAFNGKYNLSVQTMNEVKCKTAIMVKIDLALIDI